jgi:hypothetical protein
VGEHYITIRVDAKGLATLRGVDVCGLCGGHHDKITKEAQFSSKICFTYCSYSENMSLFHHERFIYATEWVVIVPLLDDIFQLDLQLHAIDTIAVPICCVEEGGP